MTFYSTEVFRSVGLDKEEAIYGTIILSVVEVFMTVVCMFIVEKAGRKILIMFGMFGMSLAWVLFTLCRIFNVT
jgi:hypothetical protein